MDLFSVDYFIDKFKAIPEEKWGIKNYILFDKTDKETRCAVGFCRDYTREPTIESDALLSLFQNADLDIFSINDRKAISFPQDTPKQRILAALEYIKKINYVS